MAGFTWRVKCIGVSMNCFEIQCLITPFIKEELEHDEMKAFLEHIKKCESCKEDVEVYFTLFTGMKQLESNEMISNQFHVDLEEFIHKQEEVIREEKVKKIHKHILLGVFMVLLGLWFV